MAVGIASDVTPNDAIAEAAVETQAEEEAPAELEAEATDETPYGEPEEDAGEQEAASDDEGTEEAEKPAEGPKAQKRIRQLVEEKNSLADSVRAIQAESQRQLQAMEYRFQQQLQASQERYERLEQERFQVEKSRRDREAYDKMTLAEQLKYDAVRKANEDADGRETRLRQEFQQELQRRDQAIAAEQAEWKRQQRLARLSQQTDAAISNVLFKDFDPADVEPIRSDFEDIFLAYAGGKGEFPKDAAPKFRKVMERVAFALNKAKTRSSKTTVEKNRKAPAATSSSKSPSASGVKAKKPSWEELQSKGMDFIDWHAQRLMNGLD